jgi:GAF domain-containing protein/orotate phosphoribosyltransferase
MALHLRDEKGHNLTFRLPECGDLPRDRESLLGLPRKQRRRNVRAFLDRWHFEDMLEGESVSFEGTPDYEKYSEKEQGTHVMELCDFSDKASIDIAALRALDKDLDIQTIFQGQMELTHYEIGFLSHIIVRELGKNIYEHNPPGVNGIVTMRLIEPFGQKENWEELLRLRQKRTMSSEWERDFLSKVGTNGYLELVIFDNGRGIHKTLHKTAGKGKTVQEVLQFAFDRFSTSKPKKDKNMRGLFWVKKHIEDLGGLLCVRNGSIVIYENTLASKEEWKIGSEERKELPGTLFQILIPLSKEHRTSTYSTVITKLSKKRKKTSGTSSFKNFFISNIERKYEEQDGEIEKKVVKVCDDLEKFIEDIGHQEIGILDFSDFGRGWDRNAFNLLLPKILQGLLNDKCIIGVNLKEDAKSNIHDTAAWNEFYKEGKIFGIFSSTKTDIIPYWVGLDPDQPDQDPDQPDQKKLIDLFNRMVETELDTLRMEEDIGPDFDKNEQAMLMDFIVGNTSYTHRETHNGRHVHRFVLDSMTLAEYPHSDGYFRKRLKDQIEIFPGVRHSSSWYFLPSGKYFKEYFDLSRLFVDNPFQHTIKDKLRELVGNITEVRYAVSSTPIGGELSASICANTSLQENNLGYYDDVMWKAHNLRLDRDAKVLIVTDIIGTGNLVNRMIDIVRENGGIPYRIVALMNTSGETTIQGIPVLALLDRKLVAFDSPTDTRQVMKIHSVTMAPVLDDEKDKSILNPVEFWNMVQKTGSLYLGYRNVRGKHYEMYIQTDLIFNDSECSDLIVQRIQDELQRQGWWPDYVLIPDSKISSAYLLRDKFDRCCIGTGRTILASTTEQGLIVSESIRDLLSRRKVLVFDAGASSGMTLHGLLSNITQASEIKVFAFISRMSEQTKEYVQKSLPNIRHLAIFYQLGFPSYHRSEDVSINRAIEELRDSKNYISSKPLRDYIDIQIQQIGGDIPGSKRASDLDLHRYSKVVDNKSLEEVLEAVLCERDHKSNLSQFDTIYDEAVLCAMISDISKKIDHFPQNASRLFGVTEVPSVRCQILRELMGSPESATEMRLRIAGDEIIQLAMKAGIESKNEVLWRLAVRLVTKNQSNAVRAMLDDILHAIVSNQELYFPTAYEFGRGMQEERFRQLLEKTIHSEGEEHKKDKDHNMSEVIDRLITDLGMPPPHLSASEKKKWQIENKLSTLLREASGQERIYRTSVENTCSIMEAHECSILVAGTPMTQLHQVVCVRDGTIHRDRVRYTMDEIPAGWVATNEQSLRIENLFDTQKLRMSKSADKWQEAFSGDRTPAILSYVGSPIFVEDNLFGVIQVVWKVGGGSFPSDAIEDLKVIAKLVGNALGLSRGELVWEHERLDDLLNCVGEVASTLDIEEVLNIIIDVCMTQLGAEWGGVMLADDKKKNLIRMIYRGEEKDWPEEMRYRILSLAEDSSSERAFRSGEIFISADARKDGVSKVINDVVRACATVPLSRGKGRESTRIGVLTVWHREIAGISNLYKSWLQMFSDIAALAIDNAYTHAELISAERSGAWRRLATMAAHVLNSRVVACQDLIFFLKERIETHPESITEIQLKEDLTELEDSIAKLGGTLDSFGRFQGPLHLKLRPVQLSKIIHEAERKQEAHEPIRLECHPSIPRNCIIEGDSDHLLGVFCELMKNAFRAQTRDPVMNIRQEIIRDNRQLSLLDRVPLKPVPPYIELIVSNPCLAGDAKIKGVFEFFKRERGGGTGLQYAQEIIEKHDGTIEHLREHGLFCLRIRLPIIEQ